MGNNAFGGCWNLSTVEIPASCKQVDLSGSGICRLDLRDCRADDVDVMGCAMLRFVVFPVDFTGVWWATHCRHVRLTVGNRSGAKQGSWWLGMRLDELRFLSALSILSLIVTQSGCDVFAEVGSVHCISQCSRPALP
jgi:hypothetical protein